MPDSGRTREERHQWFAIGGKDPKDLRALDECSMTGDPLQYEQKTTESNLVYGQALDYQFGSRSKQGSTKEVGEEPSVRTSESASYVSQLNVLPYHPSAADENVMRGRRVPH